MPANLTPQYLKAEEEYRRALSVDEQIACLEKMFLVIPKHKGTEKIQADLKSKLKDAKEDREAERSAPKKVKGFKVVRQGPAQVVLVGAPNAGKSRIVAELTNAKPEVAPYPFTTREPLPAMMPWNDVAVQLVDTPPVTDSIFEPFLSGLVRSTDLVLLVFDGSSDDAPEQTSAVVAQFAARKTVLADRTGFDEDDFSKIEVKTLLVVTHADDADADTRLEFLADAGVRPFKTITVELDHPSSCETLRDAIYGELDLIRVYTKLPGKPAEMTAPFALPRGATVGDLAYKIHADLAAFLKFAKIWGDGVHAGQQVSQDHVLVEGNVVELHS